MFWNLSFRICVFSKINLPELFFSILTAHKPFLWSCEVPHKIWARSVQPKELCFCHKLRFSYRTHFRYRPQLRFILSEVYTSRGLYYQRFILSEVYTIRGFYYQRFILSEVYTIRGLYYQRFILSEVYTIRLQRYKDQKI